MKKIVLTLIFIFSFSSLTQVNALTNETFKKDCATIAFELQQNLEDNGVDKKTANEVASLIYDICEAANDSFSTQN